MSELHYQDMECGCGRRSQVKVIDSLHVSADPELRQTILDGALHVTTCPGCGRSVMVDALLSYTDFPRRHWFTVVPMAGMAARQSWRALAKQSFCATMLERVMPMVRDMWAQDMKQRVIFGLASLREKLVLFDADLDDRPIELFKLGMARDLGWTVACNTYFHLTRVDGELLRFELMHESGPGTRELVVPIAAYHRLAHELAGVDGVAGVDGMSSEVFDELIVDFRVAFVADRGDDIVPGDGSNLDQARDTNRAL